MNMMTKICASTAMSAVGLEEQDAALHTITLPLITPDVSPALAAMIEAYADAVNSHNNRETDDGDGFNDGGLMERITAWPAKSYADLAAKMALSMYELQGSSHITAEAVCFPDDFASDLVAENLMIAVARDAHRNAAAASPIKASLIMSLHARYEAAYEEYNHIEETRPKAPGNSGDPSWYAYARADRGLEENFRETSLLRQMICYQVPSTDEELTVLAFHVWSLFDTPEMLDEERRALDQGLNSMFDYLVCEGRADMGKAGSQFATGAMLAWHRRRYRTGLTAEDLG